MKPKTSHLNSLASNNLGDRKSGEEITIGKGSWTYSASDAVQQQTPGSVKAGSSTGKSDQSNLSAKTKQKKKEKKKKKKKKNQKQTTKKKKKKKTTKKTHTPILTWAVTLQNTD